MRAEIIALRAELEGDDFVHGAGRVRAERAATAQQQSSNSVRASLIVSNPVGLSDGVHAGGRCGEVLTI